MKENADLREFFFVLMCVFLLILIDDNDVSSSSVGVTICSDHGIERSSNEYHIFEDFENYSNGQNLFGVNGWTIHNEFSAGNFIADTTAPLNAPSFVVGKHYNNDKYTHSGLVSSKFDLTKGRFSCWINTNNVDSSSHTTTQIQFLGIDNISTESPTVRMFDICFAYDGLTTYNNGHVEILPQCSENVWYRLIIDFDCDNYTFDIDVLDRDETVLVTKSDMEFRYPHESLKRIYFTTGRDGVRTYLDDITLMSYNGQPPHLDSLATYSDELCWNVSYHFEKGEIVYLKATGEDIDPTYRDRVTLKVTNNRTGANNNVILWETGKSSGIYQGFLTIPLDSERFDEIIFNPIFEPDLEAKVIVDIPIILDIPDEIIIFEHDPIYIKLVNDGWVKELVWNFNTSGEWLILDSIEEVISGIPTNPNVGTTRSVITASDLSGHVLVRYMNITVSNILPNIITSNKPEAMEGYEYLVDYDSDEDLEGGISWELGNGPVWLTMDPYTGVLKGTPEEKDIGIYWLFVVVDDGNGGRSRTNYNLTVVEKPDPPKIVSVDITQILQGEEYFQNYEAQDPDRHEYFEWSLVTDSTWLSMDGETGILSGIPGPHDVGKFEVNVTVTDKDGLRDSHHFVLTVLNKNDPPVFVDVPSDSTIVIWTDFSFDVNASDVDGDKLTYSISSIPSSDIKIDPETGHLIWSSSKDIFGDLPLVLFVTVEVSDGVLSVEHQFMISLEFTKSPMVELLTPWNGEKISPSGALFSWHGSDPEGEPITYDIFLHESEYQVDGLMIDALVISECQDGNRMISGLQPGSIYYWTVIPYDGGTHGTCMSGVYSFTVNNPPEIDSVEEHIATDGKTFRYRVKATDIDTGDMAKLTFSLDEGPKGMVIDAGSGILEWTPKGQVGLFSFKVNVTDGIDISSKLLYIEVEEKETSDSIRSLLLIWVFGVLFSLSVIVVFTFLIIRNRRGKYDIPTDQGIANLNMVQSGQLPNDISIFSSPEGPTPIVSPLIPIEPMIYSHNDGDYIRPNNNERYQN